MQSSSPPPTSSFPLSPSPASPPFKLVNINSNRKDINQVSSSVISPTGSKNTPRKDTDGNSCKNCCNLNSSNLETKFNQLESRVKQQETDLNELRLIQNYPTTYVSFLKSRKI